MNYFKTIGAAAILLSASTAANAASIDFSNIATGGLLLGPFNVGGAALTIDADTFNVVQPASLPIFDITLNNDVDAAVTVDNEGLGVDNGGGANPGSDDVDGRNFNDILLFSFDRAVDLFRIDFDNTDNNDDFVFFAISDAFELAGSISVEFFDIGSDGSDEGFFNFGPAIAGTIFGIGAVQNNDNFRVEGMTVEVSAVPLPAAGLMLLAGVGGLAAMRRRKKA